MMHPVVAFLVATSVLEAITRLPLWVPLIFFLLTVVVWLCIAAVKALDYLNASIDNLGAKLDAACRSSRWPVTLLRIIWLGAFGLLLLQWVYL